jgi:hypothetical protein
MKEICKKCYFFEVIGDGKSGECHESPPDTDGRGQSSLDKFPVLGSEEWCGKFKKGPRK